MSDCFFSSSIYSSQLSSLLYFWTILLSSWRSGSKLGLNILNESSAVENIKHLYCGWNLNSFIFFYPWCRKSSCGGISIPFVFICCFYASISCSSISTEKSQRVILLSSDATASTDASLGSNWRDVIADVCHRIFVMESNYFLFPWAPSPSILKSQILNSPLSSPDASKNLVFVFQLIVLISQSWA